MDLSKKLSFYSQNKSVLTTTESELPSSLRALKEHFQGEIIFDHSPILKIKNVRLIREYTNKNVSINLVSKNEFTEPVPRDQCVFFDLETTGLAGGAGTFAFLIGFAYWQDENLITEQYFLPDFGREYELFTHLLQWLNQFDYIVSYNGKSYDMPLLNTRFVLNRLAPEFKQKKHIDIIHMCRRIWKNSLPSCSLKAIETLLLGIAREGDIPGEFIPQAYFNFINTGVIHDVIRMVNHNKQDIISLALIFDKLHAVSDDIDTLPLDENAWSCLAKIACETNTSEFFNLFEKGNNLIKNIPDEFKYWESLYHKKNNAYERACELWMELAKNTEYFFFTVQEIAKYYEHKVRDYKSALDIIDRAFKRFDLEEELGINIFDADLKFNLEKRYQRLINKIND